MRTGEERSGNGDQGEREKGEEDGRGRGRKDGKRWEHNMYFSLFWGCRNYGL